MRHTAPLNYDLVIIGGGLAGQTLAYALRNLTDFRIAIIEPVPFEQTQQPSFDERVLALNHISQQILHGMGLWTYIAASACPIQHIHISDRGQFGQCRLHYQDYQVDALGYVIPIHSLGEALYPALQQCAQIDFYCPATLSDLYSDQHHSYLTIQHGEQSLQLKARLTVGADGHQAKSRTLMRLPVTQHDYQQTAIISNVQLQGSHNHIAYERFTEGGPIALLPMSDNRYSLVWTVQRGSETALMQASDTVFLQQLQHAFGYRTGHFIKTGQRHCYPLQLIHAPQCVQHRFVLISNSAQNLHPIAGQGFNLGLRDIATLAEYIHDAHQQQQDIGDGCLLQRYQQVRQQDKHRVITFTDGLTRLFSNQLPLLSPLRGIGLSITDKLPWLKQQIALQAMGYSGEPPRLACGLTLSGALPDATV